MSVHEPDGSAIDMELSKSNLTEDENRKETDTLMSSDDLYHDIEIEIPVPRELEMPLTPRIPRKSFADINVDDCPASTSTSASIWPSAHLTKSGQASRQKNADRPSENNTISPKTPSDIKKTFKDCEDVVTKKKKRLFALLLAVMALSVLIGFVAGYYIREDKYRQEYLYPADKNVQVCVVSSVPTSLTSEQLQYQQQAMDNTSKERIHVYASTFSQSQCMSGTPCSQNLTDKLVTMLRDMGHSKVDVSTYNVLVSLPDLARPSTLCTMDEDGNVVHNITLYGGGVDSSTNTEKLTSGNGNLLGGMRKRAITDESLVDPLPMYVPYSVTGTAKGDLLYVHCASADDFATIEDMEIDVTGRIAISRQCDMITMQQVKNVEEKGMLGLILYTDPADMDGPMMRLGIDVSMGMSGMYGDPLTPGCPAIDGIHRMANTTGILPTIPVQTVTTDVAMMLLSNMTGEVAGADWHGGLSITYHVGMKNTTSPWKVQLDVHNKMEQRDIHNIMVTIPGTDHPDQYVMMGAHYTASMTSMVSVDAMSSTATGSTSMMMEAAAMLADLLEAGWQPKRTVMLGLWEGAEMGNSGATEWVEEHRMTLADRTVAYIDLDTTLSPGSMVTAETSPLLKGIIMGAADQLELTDIVTMTTLDGMGDHVPFSHMLGVPSVSFHTAPVEQGSSPMPDITVSTTMLTTKTLLLLADDPLIRYDGLSLAEMVTDFVDTLETQMSSMITKNNITMVNLKDAANKYMQTVQTLQNMVDDLGSLENPVTIAMINDRLMYMEKSFVMSGSETISILYGTQNMETFSVMIDAMSDDNAAMETVEEMLSVVQCVLQSAMMSLTLS